MTAHQFETAVQSVQDYWGTIGVFGGNPCTHPEFDELCKILRRYIPKEQCGLWSNKLFGHGPAARATFNPSRSNLNVHLDQEAFSEFKQDWPESQPFGLKQDSRHSPPYVAMKDVLRNDCDRCGGSGDEPLTAMNCDDCLGWGKVYDEAQAWELISGCDINQHWSAMVGVFRGELRGWFCEIAGAQSMLHQHEPDYPDTGVKIEPGWWHGSMDKWAHQVRKHCHECGVPLRGYGELAQSTTGWEQVSATHQSVYQPKVRSRNVELVTELEQLGKPLVTTIDYLGNANR